MAGGTPLAQAFIRVRPDTSDFQREAERELESSGRRAGAGFGEGFQEGVRRSDVAEESGQETGKKFGAAFADSLKIAAGVAMAKIGEVAAQGMSSAFGAALDATGAVGRFQADLGVTQEQSKKIGESAGRLFSQAYGENMQEVNEAVTSVIRNIDGMKGASSDALETMTKRAITTGGILKADVGDVTKAVSQLLRTGLAPNAEAAFDLITSGAQQGADANGDLLDTINEYSTQFREVGLSGPKAMGLLAQATRAGARDLDTAADAIKEFAILSKDAANPTVQQAFKDLGFNSKQMFATFNKGGPEADKAFKAVIQNLKAIKDPVKQGELAIALFGTKAEDLGDALYAFDPTTAVQQLGNLKGATDKASEALGATPQARLTAFKNSLMVNITNVLSNNVIPVLEKTANAFSSVGVSGGGVAAAGVGLVGLGVAAKAASIAANAVKAGVSGIATAGRGIASATGAVGRFAQGFRSANAAQSAFSGTAGTIGGKLRVAFSAAASGATTLATATMNAVRATTAAAVAATRQAASTVASTTATIAQTAVTRVAAAVTKTWTVATTALNVVLRLNPIGLVITAITALIAIVVLAYKRSDTFKKIVDSAFKTIANTGKWMWNNVLKPTFNFLVQGVQRNVQVFQNFLARAREVWTGVSNAVKAGWDRISGWFSRLSSGISGVGTAFGRGASAIREAWNRVQDYTKKPINFVIGTVYNRGIVGLWNKVMGWLHLPDSMRLGTLPQLKAGGPMPVRPGVFNKPTAIVGEGNTNYPEYVIPTDPKYRGRAQALWAHAGGHMQMLQVGGILGSVKKFAGKALNIGKDALDLITNPAKVWDKLVSQLPSADSIKGSPFGNAAAAIPGMILKHARDYALKVFKAFGDGYGGDGQAVVDAALKYIGVGDDRGMDNNNIFTRGAGWPAGTPWCALFASRAISDAGAGKKYPGHPTAAVAGFENAMKHVGLSEGRPGDLATYAPSHINIIIKKAAGGYDTVGGNQGPKVNRYVRGGQRAILRPLALGGTISPSKLSMANVRAVFAERNADPNDSQNPVLNALRKTRRPLFDNGGFGIGWPFHAKKPEAVFTQEQFKDIHELVKRGGSVPPTVVNIAGLPVIPSERQIQSAVERAHNLRGRKW